MVRAVLKTAAGLLGAFLIAYGGSAWIDNQNAEEDARLAYENQLTACERGNVLRTIVFSNTQNAVRENAGRPDVARQFRQNLTRMRQVEGADPRTGAVDCSQVIEAP